MKLKKLKLYNCLGILYGLGRDEIEIDFTQFSPGLILISGKSGSGKSTILNNLHPYRTVGQDNFGKHFLPDGYRELEFEFKGHTYLSQIYVDKAQLFKDDLLLNESQKVSVYDEIVEDEIGNQDTFFDLLFAGRRFKNVLDMTKGEKKTLVVDYLLSHLKKNEQYLAICKQEQQKLLDEQYKYKVKLEAKEDVLTRLTNAEELLETKTAFLKNYKERVSQYDDKLIDEREKQEKYLEQEKKNQQTRLDIKDEESKLKTLVLTLDNQKTLFNSHLERFNSVKLKYNKLKEELQEVVKPNYTEEQVNKLLDQAYKNKEEHSKKLQESKYKKRQLEDKVTDLQDELDRLKKSILPCSSDLQLQCPLTKKTDLTGLIKSKEKEYKLAVEEHVNFEFYEYDIDLEENIITTLKSKLKVLTEYENNLEKLKRKDELKEEGKQLKTEKDELEAKLPELTKAVVEQEEKIKSLEHHIIDKYEDKTKLIKFYESNKKDDENMVITLTETIKNVKKEITDKKTELKQFDKYEEEILKLDTKVLEYDNLIKFFGPNGVVVYELELAGNEISKVANELLKNYQNKEIVIKFETMKPDSKGVLKDVFDIQCSINGGEWQSYLSDGESVLVSNSIREAMAYLKQNKEFSSVFLDELDGSIDGESRVGFLKLLEQGNEMNNRSHVFLISHSSEVHNYVEQQINLIDGEVVIK